MASQKRTDAPAGEKRKRSPTPVVPDDELQKILDFLLNDAADKFALGEGAKQQSLFDLMLVSDEYTPFQNLVMSVVMSKPISSRLGARTLLTLFGEAIGFTTPQKLRDAGEDGRYAALTKARTQHKDKTADQLGKLAEKVIEEYASDENDTSLHKMREKLAGDASNLDAIIRGFHGCGQTASDIFRRRMQRDWEELYPFADERALNAAAHLGMEHENSDALAKQIDWLLGKSDTSSQKRFATIVDTLVAIDLEHLYDDLHIEVSGGDGHAVSEPKDKTAKKQKS